MYSKLAINNVKKSMKDFTIYFLTLTFGVCLFYVFNSIESQQAMLALNNTQRQTIELLKESINIISIFVSVILGFLIVYANNFLIKRRKKELGIYLTLGMERRSVSWILIKETLLIGIFALMLGLVCGIFLSQGLAVLTAKMFEVTMKEFAFIFSKSAFYKTLLYFGIIFLIVMFFNTITVCRVKLIDLIYANKKNEKLRMKNIWLAVILFIISLICLGFSYKFIIENRMAGIDEKFYNSIILGSIGTFLFFLSLSGFLLKIVQSNKKLYFNGLNMFVLRQINSKITTTFVSMSMICIMLLISIGVLSSGAGLAKTLSQDLEIVTPIDATITQYAKGDESISKNKNYIINQMKNDGVKLDDIVDDYKTINTFNIEVKWGKIFKYMKPTQVLPKEAINNFMKMDMEVMSLSDYNNALKLGGKKTINLKENEFAITSNYNELKEGYNEFIKEDGTLTINNKEYKVLDKVLSETFYTSTMKDNIGVLVFPDGLTKNTKLMRQFVNINFKDDKEKSSGVFSQRIEEAYNHKKKPFVDYITESEVYEQSAGMSTVVSYIAIYIGTVFLITCSAVLALQQLSESSDNIDRYKLLRKIGVEEKEINRSILMQIVITFMMPLSLALVHSFVGVRVANDLIKSIGQIDASSGIIASAIGIVLIYGGYMIATYYGSKSMIKANN